MSVLSRLYRRVLFEWLYRTGKPRWDTGVTPPEVVEAIGQGLVPPGRALDIGCGTGTNAIYLARHGYRATGVDLVPLAIDQARAKAVRAGVDVQFLQGNVLDSVPLSGPFDFVLDIGCFHTLAADERQRYKHKLLEWTRQGSKYMLYAFFPDRGRRFGISAAQVEATFGPEFTVEWTNASEQDTEQDSAWYRIKRVK